MCKEIVVIMERSRATFFVKDKNVKISTEDLLYELKAEMVTNVELFFCKKIDEN